MAARFAIKSTSNGKYRFNLIAANGQVVATSEVYETKSSAKGGAEACKRAAADAEIVDETE